MEYIAGEQYVILQCVQIIKLGKVETPYIYTINQAGPSGSRATTLLSLTPCRVFISFVL